MIKKLKEYYGNLKKEDKAIFFLQISTLCNIVVAFVKLILALSLPSLWFFINACFLFVLILARGFSLRDYRKAKYTADKAEELKISRRNYLNNGIILLALGVIYFCVSLYLMFRGGKGAMHEYLTYLTALIAFWSCGSAIYGMVKYKRDHSPILSAVKITNFAYALTSIVLTQVVLLSAFSGDIDTKLFNGITGMAASVAITVFGIYMVIGAKKIR
ncbi:MAG: hypothetical protein IJW86_03460 [Clostridia bacterium]|nr:hypothetical protein [Clostridia bacterium]